MADEKNKTTTASTSQAISTINPYEYLDITPHPDGSITRRFELPTALTSSDPSATTALSKDLPLNHQTGTWVRLFVPKFTPYDPHNHSKLPVVFYYYGGGFVSDHANTKVNHDFCETLAASAAVLVVSVNYRRAPEHRLPAAYNDSMEALVWFKDCWSQGNEEWICRYADLSNCFLMGSSAGGNIAYHIGLRVTGLNLDPLRIRGLLLHTPFFGGTERTESERRLAKDPTLPLAGADLMWKLALPEGVDRDHEYCNPFVGGGSGHFERVKELGWKVLLTGCTGDPLIDRQVQLVKFLEEKGVRVVAYFSEGGYHRMEVKDPTKTPSFLVVVKDFIVSIHQPIYLH